MKIAIIGSKDFDSLEFHLNDSLTYLGNEVYHVDIKDVISIPYKYNYWAAKLFTKYDLSIFKKIANRVIEYKPDLVIGTYRFIHPECIRLIKKNLKDTPVIHINPDALTTFEYQQIFASPYDAYFTKDPFIVDFMKNKMGLSSYYLPEAFNPRFHNYKIEDRSALESKINIDVVSFGTMYPYRALMVKQLIKSGLKVSLFGTQDKRFPQPDIVNNFQNEFITGIRKSEILLGSKVVFNNFHYAEILSANVKYFEISGIGGFQVCDYKPTLDEYSGIDTSLYTYTTISEAIEKIKYYIDKPSLRYELAEKQRIHFLNNHTYDIRMNQLLSIIEQI